MSHLDKLQFLCVPWMGWVYRNVKQPESVFDHMYRMSMMALTITDHKVNKERCRKLALVHDMAECIVGDIVPVVEKQHIQEGLRKEIYEPWEEYESQSSTEAKLVKEFDLLKRILPAHEYKELEEKPGRLHEFFDFTQGRYYLSCNLVSLNEERAGHKAAGGDGLSSSKTKKPRTGSSS
uniref:5'-deoxynucleotidase HDDC2 n=1 Tax=Hucho hucho TaxID=62062 RepID=A0A4W5RDM1_9TELE